MRSEERLDASSGAIARESSKFPVSSNETSDRSATDPLSLPAPASPRVTRSRASKITMCIYIYMRERERERERESVCVCVYAYVYAHILYRERIATLDSVSNGALGMTSLHFATLVAAPTSLRQPKVQGSRLHADSRGESSAKFSSRYQARQARGRSSLATRCNGLMMRARHAAESSGIATGAGQRAKGNS